MPPTYIEQLELHTNRPSLVYEVLVQMMPTAIILINTEVGADEEIFEKLKNIPEVKQVYMVYGLYDIVAIVESEDLNKLRDIVYNRVRSMPKVKSTLTMIVVKGLSKK